MKQDKDLSNDDFLMKWKAIREKGIIMFSIRSMVPSILIIIIYVFITLTKYSNKEQNVKSMIYLSIFILLAYLVSSILKWNVSEKRYMSISKVNENNTKKI